MVANVAASQQGHQPASTMVLPRYCQSCQRQQQQVRARTDFRHTTFELFLKVKVK